MDNKKSVVNIQPWKQLLFSSFMTPITIGICSFLLYVVQANNAKNSLLEQQADTQDKRLYDLKYDLMLTFEDRAAEVRMRIQRFHRAAFKAFLLEYAQKKYPNIPVESNNIRSDLKTEKQLLETALNSLDACLNRVEHYFDFDNTISNQIHASYRSRPISHFTLALQKTINPILDNSIVDTRKPRPFLTTDTALEKIEDEFVQMSRDDFKPLLDGIDAATTGIYNHFDSYYPCQTDSHEK